MKHTSNKRAKLDRVWRPVRLAYWSQEFQDCMGCDAPSTCTHEIACGMSIRAAAKCEPCTWLAACDECNLNRFQDAREWPKERQLALKWIFDVGRFDLIRFNEVRGRAPTAITMADLRPYIISELTSSRFYGRQGL